MNGVAVFVVVVFYFTPLSAITCQTCKMGVSYKDCLKKAENYDCNRIGRTYSYCSIECNKDGIWKFGCATPTHCSIKKSECSGSSECGITCCQGSLCIAYNNVTHNPCRGNPNHQATATTVGLLALIAGVYITCM